MAMSDERIEKLSALIDGELANSQTTWVLDRIGRDSELREAWERYHLIQLAIRGEAIDPGARHMAQRMAETLSSEPSPIRRGPSRVGRVPPSMVPFGGAALAAAVAFLAVFAAPKLLQDLGDPTPAPAAGSIAALSTPSVVAERRWDLDRPELASKLDLFLVNHQEAVPAAGVKGMLPYATLVGYDDRR